MRKILFLFSLLVFVATASFGVRGQEGIKPNLAVGEVSSLGGNKITLQTKDGAIEVVLSDVTQYKRVPADNPSLKAATASSLTDIAVGDKLLVTGQVAKDKKSVPAKAV